MVRIRFTFKIGCDNGAIHEEHQEPAPEPATEDLPAAPAFEGKPRFYA
jgi:hypothetical protein